MFLKVGNTPSKNLDYYFNSVCHFEYKNQRGRTLMETLSTLAIMGVLSVVAIWGYQMAMNRHYTNEILDEARARALSCVNQIQMGNTPSLAEFSHNTFKGGTFDTNVFQTGLYHQFALKITNVPQVICQNILNTIGTNTPLRRLSWDENPAISIRNCSKENSTYLMVYNEDMQGAGSDTEYCVDDNDCQTICGKCNAITHLCENECETEASECTQDEECNGDCVACIIPTGKTEGICQSCQRVQYLESTGTQWINTGVNISATDELVATYVITLAQNSKRGLLGYSPAGQGYWGITASNMYELGAGSTNIKPTEKDNILFERIIDGDGHQTHNLYINNILAKTSWRQSCETGRFSIFAIGNGGYNSSGKIWSFQLSVNDVLVRDFIPVIAPDGKACMFNKIPDSNGKFNLFCNSGSGNFKTNKDYKK